MTIPSKILAAILFAGSAWTARADVFISDIAASASVNEWQPMDYELQDGACGRLVRTVWGTGNGKRVEIPLKVRGKYRIWLGMGGPYWDAYSCLVRLKGEPVPVRMNAAFHCKGVSAEAWQLGELEYRVAELDNPTLVLESLRGCNAALGWIRLERVDEIPEYAKSDLDLIATNDSFYPFESMDEFYAPIQRLAFSPVRKLFFCFGNGSQTFALPSAVAYAPSADGSFAYTSEYAQRAVQSFNRLYRAHPQMARELVDFAHARGMELHASFRTGCAVDHMRSPEWSAAAQPADYVRGIRRAENYCRLWDGTPVARYSYAVPAVQDFYLSFYREALASGADGLNLIFTRALPAVLFEPAFRSRFREKFGEEPSCTNDVRIAEVRCDILTDFLTRVRQVAGKRPLTLTIPGDGEEDRLFGLDVARLAKLGVVDEFLVSCDRLSPWTKIDFTKFDFGFFRRATAGTKAKFRVLHWRWWDGFEPRNLRKSLESGADGLALWDAASMSWQDWERIRRMTSDPSAAEKWAADHPDAKRVRLFKTLNGFDAVHHPWWSAF